MGANLKTQGFITYGGLSINISYTRAALFSVLSALWKFGINDTMNVFLIHTGRLSILLNGSDADVSQIGKVQRSIRRHG